MSRPTTNAGQRRKHSWLCWAGKPNTLFPNWSKSAVKKWPEYTLFLEGGPQSTPLRYWNCSSSKAKTLVGP